jgi:hypothetical protein
MAIKRVEEMMIEEVTETEVGETKEAAAITEITKATIAKKEEANETTNSVSRKTATVTSLNPQSE